MQKYETDWLASRPVFYNESTNKVSNNINDVIDFANVEFHPEGLNNYLDFGYSVFGQTPVNHVKFLRHSSRLTVHVDGRLEVEHLPDPVEQWMGRTSHEDDVLHHLQTTIQRWEKSVEGEIVVPTSGGYDSRLLNYFIEDKSRIRSFTYGISDDQSASHEVVFARELSELLGTRWEQIELGDYHRYLNDWDRLFGVSTHAHGMYHFEFYTKIRNRLEGESPVLSGVIGDAWAGSVKPLEVNDVSQLSILGYTHGMRADARHSLLKDDAELRSSCFERMHEKIRDPLFNVVEAMRFKMILLSYLIRLPSSLGFHPWSPFLQARIALGMATLPQGRRRDRDWQRDFFAMNGMNLEELGLPVDHHNTLNQVAMDRVPLVPLDDGLLSELVNQQYVQWINRLVCPRSSFRRRFQRTYPRLTRIRGGYRPYQWISAWDQKRMSDRLAAYNAYLTLKPVETLLRKRNLAQAAAK